MLVLILMVQLTLCVTSIFDEFEFANLMVLRLMPDLVHLS